MRVGAYYCQSWQKAYIKATLIPSCPFPQFFFRKGMKTPVLALLKNRGKTTEMLRGKGIKFNFSDTKV